MKVVRTLVGALAIAGCGDAERGESPFAESTVTVADDGDSSSGGADDDDDSSGGDDGGSSEGAGSTTGDVAPGEYPHIARLS